MPEFEEVLPDIWLLKVPFSTVWTGVTLLRGEKMFLIDSSADAPEKYVLPALAKLGVDPASIDWLLDTHCHGDHIGGHAALVARFGLKTAVIREGAAALADPAAVAVRIRTRFPGNSPAPQSWLKGVTPDRVLVEGESLEGRLFPIHTPGHEADCVCWYDVPTKTIVCGDSLQANGTPTQGIGFYQSLPDYRASLAKLAAFDIENILCGHDYDGLGTCIRGRAAVQQALAACRSYVDLYDAKIREQAAAGELDPVVIANRLIAEVGCGQPQMLFLALYTVTQHLATL